LVKGAIKYLSKIRDGFSLINNLPQSVRDSTSNLLEDCSGTNVQINEGSVEKMMALIDRLMEEGKILKITDPPTYSFYHKHTHLPITSLQDLCEAAGFEVRLLLLV
jgi:hypothetical protein